MAFVSTEKLFSRDWFVAYSYLIIGSLLFAMGDVMFVNPYKLAPGGVYGIANCLYHWFGFKISLSVLFMDIPLLVLGTFVLGPRFGIKTMLSVFIILGFTYLLETHLWGYDAVIQNDAMLNTIVSGVIYGVAIGLIFKSGATSGGSDIISMILNKYTKISLGFLVIVVDSTITLLTLFVPTENGMLDFRLPIYSWIVIFIEGKIIDMIVDGAKVNKTLFIISEKHEAIKNKILNDLKRGGTSFVGEGMYGGKERKVIYTILTRRESTLLRKFIAKEDPTAFINIVDSNEILGAGFKKIDSE
ncbi:YitT family protein [Prolixibacteraceae bacterium JC049]|nr:YitT family protein [Prolixibacteraceae bacterium JC049]